MTSPEVAAVKIEHDQQSHYMTLSEVEVYETVGSGLVNIAMNMTATQSSSPYLDYPADRGNDGDTATFFSTDQELGKSHTYTQNFHSNTAVLTIFSL